MKIEQRNIAVQDIFYGYVDKDDDGVFAYGGRLTIRPPYQREFVYDDKQQKAVIDTVLKGYPLNVMYWVKTGEDQYEILDGQQRTLSVMRYLSHDFQIVDDDGQAYYCDALPDQRYEALLQYRFLIYVCEGTDAEKLEWFNIVNISGVALTPQELRNSVYTGRWLSDAKLHFSKRDCVAKRIGDRYITGDPNRQELLEKAIEGISELQGIGSVDKYMTRHRSDDNAKELWEYYQNVIEWIEKVFPTYHKNMKGLDWLHYYNIYHNNDYAILNEEVDKLMEDDEVGRKSGIYQYLLAKYAHEPEPNAEKYLNLKSFDTYAKKYAYDRQNGCCANCNTHYDRKEMEAVRIVPWSEGGVAQKENCKLLCKSCYNLLQA